MDEFQPSDPVEFIDWFGERTQGTVTGAKGNFVSLECTGAGIVTMFAYEVIKPKEPE